MTVLILSENTRFDGETGAALMRNRCAFTSRDMAAEWSAAFTYAIVMGWGKKATKQLADQYGWDDEMVAFLKDARKRFKALADRKETP